MLRHRSARNELLLLLLLVGIAATSLLGGSKGTWFPQHYAHDFYLAKGCVAVVAVIATLVHMSRAWPTVITTGQRLRYLALLMVTVLIASSSTAQISDGVPVSGRNVGGLLAALLVLVAMFVSIRQDRR